LADNPEMKETSMQKNRSLISAVIGVAAMGLIGTAVLGYLYATSVEKRETIETRLQRLQDREEIWLLLTDYGRFLDRRDFASFSQLFAEKEGEWIGGMGRAKTPLAIRKLMEALPITISSRMKGSLLMETRQKRPADGYLSFKDQPGSRSLFILDIMRIRLFVKTAAGNFCGALSMEISRQTILGAHPRISRSPRPILG
jgi:hypothetical protein